jgi:hypothetical protein
LCSLLLFFFRLNIKEIMLIPSSRNVMFKLFWC